MYGELVSVGDVTVDTSNLEERLDQMQEDINDHDGIDSEAFNVLVERVDHINDDYATNGAFNALEDRVNALKATVHDLEQQLDEMDNRYGALQQDLTYERGKDGHVIDLLRQLIEAILRRA